MAFPRKLLNQDEELVLDLRPHWLFLAPATILLVLAVALGLVVAAKRPFSGFPHAAIVVVALVLLVAALVHFGWRYLKWATTMFVLTSSRILTRRGVLSKQGTEIPLERINTVFFHQSVFERMVGAGDLNVESAGDRGIEAFSDIRKPAIVQREIYVRMEQSENSRFDRMKAPGGGGLSVAEQLEKLNELVKQGALTPQQFEAEKAKLLGA